MKSELETQLAKVVEKSLSLAEQTGDFAIEQAPMLLQEFYAWHIAKNIFIVVFCLLAITGIVFLFKWANRVDVYGDGALAPVTVFGGAASIFLAASILHSIYSLVFITVAPKLYLIDYFLN